MKDPISITAIASISPLGLSKDEIWASYRSDVHCFKKGSFGNPEEWIAPLSETARKEIDELKNSDAKYKSLDDSVLFALYASRKAASQAGWLSPDFTKAAFAEAFDSAQPDNNPGVPDKDFGINIGSSRGATSLFEKYHEEYLQDKRTATLASPTTTLGNISSWVAHDLQTQGPEISHSITCSTALHALLNGTAWIKSGMTDRFLVGGSEAPLTPFTIAQMKALKIYAKSDVISSAGGPNPEEQDGLNPRISSTEKANEEARNSRFPCKALKLDKKQNTMILGEGTAIACLERGIPKNALAVIEGVGYATEPLRHNTSISTDAQCFQRSMRMALGNTQPKEVDVVVMHAPGTIKGDLSEFKAIEKVFGSKIPALTTNKWKIGHTFGASGMLSVELAILMLEHQEFVKVPFVEYSTVPKKIEKIIVNAVGFGGNAVSILLKIPF